MIADELERQMLAAYFETVCNDNESFERFQRADGPENFAIMIAKGYMEWMDEKRKSTTDEVFLMVLNFIDITNLYREFKLALNTGDAVMIEWLYKEFLPIYLYTGKKNYFEIVCGMMEEMYGKLDYKLLHLTRINRTIPLYTGVDTDGRPMANWAIDALIELVQKYYHKMNFRNDNLEGWMQHSPNVQLNNKSIRLAKTEYHRFWSESEKDLRNGTGNENDLDQARNRKKTSEPKRLQEHLAIAEFISLNKMVVETPGRKYSQDAMYLSFSSMTTNLSDESESEKSTRWMDKVVTEEEKELTSLVQEVFDSQKHGKNDRKEDNDQSTADETVLDFEEIGNDEDDEDEAEVEEELEEEQPAANSENTITVEIGVRKGKARRTIKVRKATINPLAFTDIRTCGNEMLEKRNLKVTRGRRKDRNVKEQNRKKRVLEECMALAGEGGSALVSEAKERLKARQKTSP
jgi:hypothetical protein